MSRVHDMGGRFGDGPVVPEAEDAEHYPEAWQARAMALTVAAGACGKWNIDMSRHARESVRPADYARFTYYEKWLAGLADIAVETGVLSRAELETGTAEDAPAFSPLAADAVPAALAKGAPADRDSNVAARFGPGDMVRTLRPAANRFVDGGHTRLPGYAAGATGRVVRMHGTFVLPDTNAHGLGEAPEPLYAVAFAAGEIWAAPEHPRDEVIVDLWQSYLEPA
ncbi:nitrile hydratase subunit beta [Chachezhania antarctica]|uniref:nitrile hydratase subunit beta n=1 Tax=Chachezhania antarctica TaxID=2340860 RepID=UPI000EB1FD23|nr:nitrile hydratase subunit beta [Chachezhania antarctica]|tara:strand:- start:2343 stop:3014 length:672 start_codon:yes stop_codon:yes gene_type:complete